MLPYQEEKLDPRVKRTRVMIENAFTELVSGKGFQAISVQDITERAGINRATFYAHFPDKYALLEYTVRKGFHDLLGKKSLNVCQFSTLNLHSLVVAVCEYLEEVQGHCALTEQQFKLLIAAQVRSGVHDLISHWLENKDLQSRLRFPVKRAATAASWAIYGLATEWARTASMPPVDQYADEVLPLVSATMGLDFEFA